MKSKPSTRITQIAALGETIFHAKDLANLWGIGNQNTLHTTLSRYVREGVLYRIHNGLYSLKRLADLDPYLLGVKALHAPGYVSCESVLYAHGIINQSPQEITLISTKSKRFAIGNYHFRSRQLQDTYLFNDEGIEMKNGIRIATLERALADMFYFQPKKYLDSFNTKMIHWQRVKDIVYDAAPE